MHSTSMLTITLNSYSMCNRHAIHMHVSLKVEHSHEDGPEVDAIVPGILEEVVEHQANGQ